MMERPWIRSRGDRNAYRNTPSFLFLDFDFKYPTRPYSSFEINMIRYGIKSKEVSAETCLLFAISGKIQPLGCASCLQKYEKKGFATSEIRFLKGKVHVLQVSAYLKSLLDHIAELSDSDLTFDVRLKKGVTSAACPVLYAKKKRTTRFSMRQSLES